MMISGGSFETNRLYLSVKRRPTYLKTMRISDDDRDFQVGV